MCQTARTASLRGWKNIEKQYAGMNAVFVRSDQGVGMSADASFEDTLSVLLESTAVTT
jgi:hypothetical protein